MENCSQFHAPKSAKSGPSNKKIISATHTGHTSSLVYFQTQLIFVPLNIDTLIAHEKGRVLISDLLGLVGERGS